MMPSQIALHHVLLRGRRVELHVSAVKGRLMLKSRGGRIMLTYMEEARHADESAPKERVESSVPTILYKRSVA